MHLSTVGVGNNSQSLIIAVLIYWIRRGRVSLHRLIYPCLLKAEISLAADNNMIQDSNAEYLRSLNKLILSC